MEHSILQLFPDSRRAFWRQTAQDQKFIQEIRLRLHRPIVIHREGREWFLGKDGSFTEDVGEACCASAEELEGILQHICQYSLYAFEDEIRQGFITVRGGHRVGIAGQAVLAGDGTLRVIRNISYMNIRIAHEVRGAADHILGKVYQEGRLKNVLLISPPGCGKTTLLRDLIRQVSDGNQYGEGLTVGVVDERCELAGTFSGVAQNDLGMRTDVLDACPKALGMLLLLRSMSPQVIAIDELGSREELIHLRSASACGCRILATVHGEDLEDVRRRFGTGEDWEGLFDIFFVLGKREGRCEVTQIREKCQDGSCGNWQENPQEPEGCWRENSMDLESGWQENPQEPEGCCDMEILADRRIQGGEPGIWEEGERYAERNWEWNDLDGLPWAGAVVPRPVAGQNKGSSAACGDPGSVLQ